MQRSDPNSKLASLNANLAELMTCYRLARNSTVSNLSDLKSNALSLIERLANLYSSLNFVNKASATALSESFKISSENSVDHMFQKSNNDVNWINGNKKFPMILLRF